MKGFHLRVAAPAGAVDFAARRAFYASDLARRSLEAMRATSRLAFEADGFGAVLTFFETEEDARLDDERQQDLHEAHAADLGEFRRRFDLRGVVLGAIRVNAVEAGAPALIGVGRADPPPPVPGQSTIFLARLRAGDGYEALVHVASAPPRDAWPDAEFLGRAVVIHVDRGDAMP